MARRKVNRSTDTNRTPIVAETVLDEAAQRFLVNGYHRTRMQDIADTFGVSHAALYYHFRNKQDILAQINIRAIEELLEGVKEVSKDQHSAVDRFFVLLRRHMQYVAMNPAFVATFLEHDLEIPKVEFRRIVKLRKQYTDLLVGLYDEAAGEGEVPAINATVAVSLLLGSCNWIYRWYTPTGELPVDELIEQGMALLGRIRENSG